MAEEVDAIGKKQKEIIDLQNELNALGNVADPGAEPAQFRGGYNRTDNRTFEYGTAYQVGKGDKNTDNPVTQRYPLNTPDRKAVIARDVRAYLAIANKPYNDWKANSDKFERVKKIKEKIDKAQKELTQLQTDAVSQLQTAQRDLTTNVLTDPSSVATKATVADIDADATGTTLTPEDYEATATADQYTASTIDPTKVDDVVAPESIDVAKFDAAKSQDQITQAMQGVQAAQGSLSPEAIAQAAQVDPTQTLVGGMQAAQGQATQVQGAPAPLQMTADQTISGTTVDQRQVGSIFGQQPLEAATVSGELDKLMQDFEGGQTPSWAAGAMRAATAQMAARGLGASSMAGMAVVQAAMESALPIAQMDASNKQQIAIESARQRANFLQMEFTQEFEAKVRNAARVSEIANINFNAEQQVALENARLAQTMDLANLTNRQAIVMAEAAAISQLELQNLTNQQQAAVQNAQAFLQIDMANLSNEQATVIFKNQQIAQSIFTDTAAENAALQINATSQNQANQLLANLKFNADQINSAQQLAIEQTNVGVENAQKQFNANVQNNRDQFNATNKIAIAQANALWRQNVETINTAADNAANAELAKVANALTTKAVDELWQRERDFMDYVFTSTEDSKERALELILADKKYDEYALVRDDQQQKDMWAIVTRIVLGSKGLDLI
tara:strand:+ start:537 stop:2564 length:2028 start_codon:yes stop_codon:yes gene_type:complete